MKKEDIDNELNTIVSEMGIKRITGMVFPKECLEVVADKKIDDPVFEIKKNLLEHLKTEKEGRKRPISDAELDRE